MIDQKPKTGTGIEHDLDDYYVQTDSIDSIIKDKFDETYKQKNKIKRYKTRLLKEGFKIGKEQNISFILRKIDEEHIEAISIIQLAKNSIPSLYRRFFDLINRYNLNVKELKNLINEY